MVIIQGPLIYYYTFGLFAFFVILPYWGIGIGLTLFLLVVTKIKKSKETTKFHKIGLYTTIVIGILDVFFGERLIETIDWKLRQNSRNEIVELVKNKEIEPSVFNSFSVYKLERWNFPPISNGGNEISIYRTNNNEVTVEFYINRGFLEHYSAFVYTDDPKKKLELEERTKYKKGFHINKKLCNNWYRVSY